MALAAVLGLCAVGSVGAVAAAGALLLFPGATRKTLVPCLVSYATGTLLGAAFLGLIPEALDRVAEEGARERVLAVVLAGIVGFFVLEKLVIWRHCHREECDVHPTAGELILIGDAFHNLIDGVVIAASFLNSAALGVAATVAVVAHEVPQEAGDFGILLDSGFSPRRALSYNVASSLPTILGGLVGYLALDVVKAAIPYVMAASASSFIYIAVADLIPGLQRKGTLRSGARQLALMLAGIATIALVRSHAH